MREKNDHEAADLQGDQELEDGPLSPQDSPGIVFQSHWPSRSLYE
jgi:hypothetical protein